jgi:PAS domain S-box-containing protein
MKKRVRSTVLGACFGLTVIVLAANAVIAVSNTYRLTDNNRRVLETDTILTLLEETLSTFKDAETGQRGYLLTGADRYLEPYKTAARTAGGELSRLRALCGNNPEQQERINLLESKWSDKIAELKETLTLRQERGTEAATRVVLTDRGKEIMDDIRKIVATMEAVERNMLNRRVAESAASLGRARTSLVVATTVALLLVILFYVAVTYHLAARRNDEQALRDQLERWQVTLASIADTAVATDHQGRVTFLNASAQALTGRALDEALGQPLEAVFPIVNWQTRERIEGPVRKVLQHGKPVGLANHSAVIAQNGSLIPIDDSAAPIRDQRGNILGVVLVAHEITEVRKALRQLENSEARTRAILETAVDSIITIDERGTVESVNPAGERLFGYKAAELLGQNVKLLMPEPYRSEHDTYLDHHRTTGEKKIIGIGREVVGQRKDGATFPVELAVSEMWLGDRRFFTGIVRDVTERNRAEQAQRLLAAVVESSTDAIISKTLDGMITSWNEGAERMFGYSAAEAVGRHISMIAPPDHRQEMVEILERIRGGERVNPFQTVRLRKDGERIDISLAVSPVRDSAGQIIGASKVARDITELKRAEKSLLVSQQRLRAVVDQTFQLSGILSADGTLMEVNRAAMEFERMSHEELIGKPLWETNCWKRSPEIKEKTRQAVIEAARGQTIRYKAEVFGPAGQSAVLDVSIRPIRDDSGSVAFLIAEGHDITEYVRAEDKLRFYAEELEERNAELLRSNQDLDDFAYIASHDLKEPLRGIQNYATFLIEDYGDKLDENGRIKLETLKELTQRMYALIDSLLQFSRVGRANLAIQNTDLNQVISEVLDSLRISLQEQDVQIRIPRPLPTMRCDRVRIAEVYHNLITNAIKYNDKPEKWIEIGWHIGLGPGLGQHIDSRQSAKQSHIVLTIRDNGIGIPEKFFDSIFRMFKRLHARDKFGGGNGVGLTIVKKNIERHGGRIWVESTCGEGTTFAFTLPGEKGHAATAPTDPDGRG